MTQPTLKTLASFAIDAVGFYPVGDLTADVAGNLYGTTSGGGSAGQGTVFELAYGTSSVTKLAAFTGKNSVSFGGLAVDANGNIYGTTADGSGGASGTVFELAHGASSITTLATFTGLNGNYPYANVIADVAGNLYGTTLDSGSAGYGTVFELAHGALSITTLATFVTYDKGDVPCGRLTVDAAGNLYGTTFRGGSAGFGTVFELAHGASSVITLATFTGLNGAKPFAGLIADAAGNLFGTTEEGGSAGLGTVFELAHGTSSIATLATFAGLNGSSPTATLIADAAGNLYGTTESGGNADGVGTVFEITNSGFIVPVAPIIALVSAPSASNAQTATLGSVTPGIAGDALTVTLTSDARFATGSNLAIVNGILIYTPGLVTAAQVGSDSLTYTVTDTINGAVITETQVVALSAFITLGAGIQKVTVSAGSTYLGGSGADEFVVNASTIAATIDGGSSGKNSLTVTGGGAVTMGANITDIAAVRLIAGAGTSPYNFTANDLPGLVIFTSTGPDIIHDGAGGDIVNINSAAATVFGGGGKDTFYVTAATIGATIDGGTGHSSLGVKGGGAETMGANITHISEVHLMGGTPGAVGFDFTANATQNLAIVGSAGNDTIHVGDASQTVSTLGRSSLVLATAATAGAKVQAIGAGNVATLEIVGGGTATLNGNDGHGLLVVLDAATHLDLGTAAFITATATTAGSTLVAHQCQQTLASLAGGATMVGYSGGSDTFLGSKAGLTGDTITGLTANDKIDVTDLAPLTGVNFTQTSVGQGTLSLGFGRSLTLTGTFNPSHFHVTTDGHAGSFVTYG